MGNAESEEDIVKPKMEKHDGVHHGMSENAEPKHP